MIYYTILYHTRGGGQFSYFYICLFAPKSLFLPFSTLVIEWWKSIFFEVLHFTKILKLDLHRLLQLLDQVDFFLKFQDLDSLCQDSDSSHELMLSPLIDHWTLECHDRCLSLAQGWVARQTTSIIADPGMGCLTTVAGCPISWQIASAFCSTAVPSLFHCFRLDYQLSAQSHMIYNDFMICW